MFVWARGSSSAPSRIAQALRLAAICVLVILTSGVLPVASHWLEDIRGCGDLCARCDCKRRAAHATLRAPCPCCQSHPASPGHFTSTEPALPPGSMVAPFGLEASSRVSEAPVRHPSFTPSIPHPPPRPITFA